ncbi:hypothetical protein CCR75_004753 [Bremia lactucae]|uniref:Uncharacterized protein n=1 Tax=Bremia lactucae TaxID=4779 RepID=A0A976IEN5_BRELC|nr:hypothetical protein CCR75_004753 [Bremia lactucae]
MESAVFQHMRCILCIVSINWQLIQATIPNVRDILWGQWDYLASIRLQETLPPQSIQQEKSLDEIISSIKTRYQKMDSRQQAALRTFMEGLLSSQPTMTNMNNPDVVRTRGRPKG